jgi:hypothetical protein
MQIIDDELYMNANIVNLIVMEEKNFDIFSPGRKTLTSVGVLVPGRKTLFINFLYMADSPEIKL